MKDKQDSSSKLYYFIDINLQTKQIIGWGTQEKDQVEVNLTEGFHRVFLSTGQYNKLTSKLSQSQ